MRLIIEIEDAIYHRVMELCYTNTLDRDAVINAVKNGTPLPEHHGRLIDADRLTRAEIMHLWYHLPNGDIACPKVDIDHAPTIIEGSDSE